MKKKLLGIFLLSTLFLTGCTEINLSSTIRTDGTAVTEFKLTITQTEEEWAEWVQGEPIDNVEDLSDRDGVSSYEVIEIDEEVEGGIKKGGILIIETDNLEAFSEITKEILGDVVHDTHLNQNGDDVEFIIEIPKPNDDGSELSMGLDQELDIEFKLRINVEGRVLDHNAKSVSGSIYEWDFVDNKDDIYIKFLNVVEEYNDELESPQVDDQQGENIETEQDNAEAEAISDTYNNDIDDNSTKIIVLGVVFGLIAILSLVALKVSKNGL